MKANKTIKFEEYMVDQIIDGEKTLTIRPFKSNKVPYKKGEILHIVSVLEKEETLTNWKIVIKDVDFKRLHSIPLQTLANANGDYENLWNSFYGDTKYAFEKNPKVCVYKFELGN